MKSNGLKIIVVMMLVSAVALTACGFNPTNPGTLTRVTGSGKVVLVGKIDQLNVTLGGAGAFNSENAECKRATVTNNGASAAIVLMSESLNATINGIGYIEYIGNPQVTKSVNGIGAVRQR
jgi:hypothetical protein